MYIIMTNEYMRLACAKYLLKSPNVLTMKNKK